MATDQVVIGKEDTHAVIFPKGGIAAKFVVNDTDFIYPYRIVEGGKARGGIPICLPFLGRRPEYEPKIPKHGWLRDQELTVFRQSQNLLCLTGNNSHINPLVYPWRLSYSIIFEIIADGMLAIELQIKREKDGVPGLAPINPAFHPYFSRLGMSCRAQIVRDFSVIPLFPNDFLAESKIVNDWGETILFFHGGENGNGRMTTMILSGDFGLRGNPCFNLWSDDNKKYFCIEPVATHPSQFNTLFGMSLCEEEALSFSLLLAAS